MGAIVFTYSFLFYTAAEIRAQGISLDEPRAVDYVFEILPAHLPRTGSRHSSGAGFPPTN
jgi:hypothetical protein